MMEEAIVDYFNLLCRHSHERLKRTLTVAAPREIVAFFCLHFHLCGEMSGKISSQYP